MDFIQVLEFSDELLSEPINGFIVPRLQPNLAQETKEIRLLTSKYSPLYRYLNIIFRIKM